MVRKLDTFFLSILFSAMVLVTSCTRSPLGEVVPQDILNAGFALSHSCTTSVNERSVFTCQIQTVDVIPDLVWNLEPTNTCSWATINAATGEITGTTTANPSGCNIVVRSQNSSRRSVQLTISIAITNIAPTLTIANATAIDEDASLTVIRNDAAVQASEEVFGGSYSFDHATTTAPSCFSNSLALTINSTNGAVSYRPAADYNGTCYIKVLYNDGSGYADSTVSAEFSLVINPVEDAPTISYSGVYTYMAGQTLVAPITPTLGGSAPTSCSSSPALPTGLVINSTTCMISGTPTITTPQQLYSITASNGAGSATANVSIGILSATPSQITLSGISSFTTTACTLYNLTTRDAYGNVATVTSNTTFNLSSTDVSGIFYTDSNCSSSTPNAVIAHGTSSASFYYRQTISGAATINVNLFSPTNPAISSASRNVTVATSTPARLGLVVAPTGTAVSCNIVTINVLDSSNNSVNATSSMTVNLTGTNSAAFFSDSNCATASTSLVIAAGANTGTRYMRKTTAGSSALTATSLGVANGTGTIVISAAPAGRIIFSAAATIPYAAATCQAYTLQTRDALNNNTVAVTADTVVTLSGVADGSFYSNSTCTPGNQITSTTILNATSSRIIYYSKPTTTSVNPGANIALTASVVGWSPDATTSVNVSTGVPTHLATTNTAAGISIFSATNVAIASRCLLTTVIVRDELNALVPASAVTSNITATLSGGGAGAQFWSNSTCTTPISTITINAGTNSRNFYYSSSTTTSAVAFSWTNGGLSGSGGSRNVTVTNGIPSRLTWTTAPTTFNINTCQTFTFNVRDANLVANVGANVSAITDFQLADGSDGIFYANAGCVNPITTVPVANGAQVATFYYRKATPAAVNVSVVLQSPTNPPITTLLRAVTVNAVPNNILITATPSVGLVANQSCSLLSIQSRNGVTAANVTANSTFTFAATNGAQFYYDSGCTAAASPINLTISSGASTASGLYIRGTNAGNVTISGTGPLTVNNLTLSYTATPPTMLTITGPTIVVAGISCGTHTITSQDANGIDRGVLSNTTVSVANVGAQSVQFYSDASCSTPLPGNAITMNTGTSSAVFYVRGSTAGSASIQVTAPGLTSATHSLTVQ